MKRKQNDNGDSPATIQPLTGSSEWRKEARLRRTRMEVSEELFGTSFDILSGKDMMHFLLTLGAAEIGGGTEVGIATASISAGAPVAALAAPGAALAGAIGGAMLAAGQFCFVMSLWVFMKAMSYFSRRFKRPIYYPQERIRRRNLAHERRRIRKRFTINACPKPSALLEQYAKIRRNVREAIRFGSMLCDIEAYSDNSLIRNVDGEIIGRNAGIKGWLRLHCPELAAHYKSVMRYKAMAEKFRQAVGANDPVPAAVLAERDLKAAEALFSKGGRRKTKVRNIKPNEPRQCANEDRTLAIEIEEIAESWHQAQKILAVCEGSHSSSEEEMGKAEKDKSRLRCGSMAGLEEVLARKLGPEFAPSGWKMAFKAPPRAMA